MENDEPNPCLCHRRSKMGLDQLGAKRQGLVVGSQRHCGWREPGLGLSEFLGRMPVTEYEVIAPVAKSFIEILRYAVKLGLIVIYGTAQALAI